MTDRNGVTRRTLMGSLAALSAGKATSATVAASTQEREGDERQAGTNSDHLPDYANPAGRVNHEGLQRALDDWNNGDITNSELDAVREAFRTGERVVSKDVQTITSNIDDATLLEKNPDGSSGEAVVWQFDGNIGVNAELEIEAGAVLEFTQGSNLQINSGPLLANGSQNDEIFVTGTAARQGWYGGIYVDSNDLQNSMQHTLVEYGGRGSYRGCVDIGSGGGDSGSMAVTNCTLRWSGEYGLYQSGSSNLIEEGENVYAENREAGVRTATSNVQQFAPTSEYNNNDRNYVFVVGNKASDAGADEETRVWNNLPVPYRMQGSHTIDDLTLGVEAGTTLEFTQQSDMEFQGGSRIDLQGEDGNPITLTGANDDPGWWNGVYLDNATDSENIFNHCVFEYGANDWTAPLAIATGGGDSGATAIRNCTFRENNGFGFDVGGGGAIRNCANNTYTGNVDGAARIGTENMQSLSSTSDFTGNDNDYVLVTDRGLSGEGRDSDARTWDALNVPYRMDGYHNVDGIELSIEPGAVFEFTENAAMEIQSDVRVSISGKIPDGNVEPITFTGTDKQPGWWRGVYFHDATDQENSIEFTIFEYAGASDWDGAIDLASGGGDSAYLEFVHCTFQNNANYGVKVGGSGVIANLDDNLYTGNGEGAMYIPTYSMEALDSDSDFTGNDTDIVRVWNSGINGDGAGSDSRTWDALNVPYRLEDGWHDIDNVELSIEPGATLEFTENAGMEFEGGSRFVIVGKSNSEITFTGSEEKRGWWNGFYINNSESQLNRLEQVIVEYAGSGDDGQLNIATGGGDSGQIGEISNCTFRNGDGYGIEWGGGARVRNMSKNVYTNHTQGAVKSRTDNIHELSGDSDFTGNDKDRVLVKDQSLQSQDVSGEGATWDSLNVPYEMTAGTHDIRIPLTVEPGSVLEFQEEALLLFNKSGQIDITGTSEEEILLTATEKGRNFEVKGWWYGIYIEDATSSLNSLEQATVEWAGRSGSQPGGAAAVDIASGGGDDGYLEVRNSTIRKSGSIGIYALNQAVTNSDVCNVNTFEDNNAEDCFIDD